jgi:DNA replication initiation complex subunit (GINS family)
LPEINITYDLLFDVLRNEKSREELQKLDDKFYRHVVEYIRIKESFINDPNTTNTERELTRIQLGNVKRLIVELYDRREKKIINLTIYKIKTSSGAINTEALLEEEKYLFDTLYSGLSRYRSSVLSNIIEGKMPATDVLNQIAYSDALDATRSTGNKQDVEREDIADSVDGVKSIRFIKPVPKFLGTELEIYGPFEENDIASLPSRIAKVLIKKERAEEMNLN